MKNTEARTQNLRVFRILHSSFCIPCAGVALKIHHSSLNLLHSPSEGGRSPGPAVQGSSFEVRGSRFPAPNWMLDVRCWMLDVFRSPFCFLLFPPVLWSMVNSRWSPRPPRTLDFRLQTLDSSPSPRRLVGHSPEHRRKPCQGDSIPQPGRPLAELSILKGWQNPAQG